MKVFTTIPFFRIFIPFILGVLLGIYFDFKIPIWIPTGFFLGASVMFLLRRKVKSKFFLLILLDFFLFSSAISLVDISNGGNDETHYTHFICPDSTTV